jgi:hypothetical protein
MIFHMLCLPSKDMLLKPGYFIKAQKKSNAAGFAAGGHGSGYECTLCSGFKSFFFYCFLAVLTIPEDPWCWNIYLGIILNYILGVNVGK